MIYKLAYTIDALDDINRAHVHYESRSAGLGGRFTARLSTALDTIARMPHLFGEIVPSVRAGMPSKFPYVIYYHIDGAMVVVFAVLHGATDPAVWQSRL